MNHMPSIERLESVHSFPGSYTFKLFGPNDGEFAAGARRTAVALVGNEAFVRSSERESSRGKHLCVTLEVHVQSAEHVRALYDDFVQLPDLRLLL